MKKIVASIYLTLCAGAFAADTPAVHIARYRGDAKAAFSYTFDDGRKKEAEDALSVLDSLRIRGTFFVMPLAIDKIGASFLTWDDLKKMQAKGHEIGTHAQVSTKFQDVDDATVSAIVNGGWELIRNHTDIAPVSFAYPGGSLQNIPRVQAIVAEHHFFVRGKVEGYGSVGNRHWTPEVAQANVLKAEETGDWIVAMVHSIVKGYSPFKSIEEFRGHCEWLVAQGEALWIAPFGEVSRYVNERDAAKLNILKSEHNELRFELLCEIRPEALYNTPLTVVVSAIAAKQATATVGGKDIPVMVRDGKILVDVSPGIGPMVVKWN